MSDLFSALDRAIEEARNLKSTLATRLDLPDGMTVAAPTRPLRLAVASLEAALECESGTDGHIPLPFQPKKVDKPGPAAKAGRAITDDDGVQGGPGRTSRTLADPAPLSPPGPDMPGTLLPVPGVGVLVASGKPGRTRKTPVGKADGTRTPTKAFKVHECLHAERLTRPTCRAHCPKYREMTGACCPFVRDDPANCDDKRKQKCLGKEAAKVAK